ncbi:MAG: Ig-like domain-containing protein [Colwellia sp.]|nr:Ig-like domain-containing protein [Colwellia sp.]
MELLRRFSFTLLLMSLMTLVACGGGDGDLTGGGDGGVGDGDVIVVPDDGPVAESITLLASSQQLASSGVQTVTLTAIAKDGNNNLLPGVKVVFTADSGGLQELFDTSGNSLDITGPDGKATRELSTLAEPTNRIVTTTVSSGEVSDVLDVQVLGTTVTLTGSSSLALNDVNNYIVKVLDSDGNGLANTLVVLSLSNESTETPADSIASITLPETVTTDFNGQVAVSVMGTSGGTNSIIATALAASAEQAVTVQADSFLFTDFGDGTNNVNPSTSAVSDILLSKTATVSLMWLRSGIAVPDGTKVSFTTTRGTLASTSVTTVAGKVTTTLTSTNAGKALLTITGTDTIGGKVIELNNQLEFEFVADSADRLIAQAFPQAIGPNAQTSTVSVVVRDASGNLVKNKTVDFVLTDTNGGAIFPASAITNSNGSASTVYTSNSTSANDGVAIQATVRDTPSVTDEVFLTVAEREAFITLGTGNSIEIGENSTTYIKKYSIYVTDINSRPRENVTLTVSAIPKQYFKGFWTEVLKDGEFDHYATAITAVCDNEDKNQNSEVDAGEDDDPVNGNNDGELTPGNLVSVFGDGINAKVITNEQGEAVLDIVYPESFGGWATVEIIVSTKVGGTESFARALHLLYVANEDVTVEGNPPGGNIHGLSDFGTSSNCTDPD